MLQMNPDLHDPKEPPTVPPIRSAPVPLSVILALALVLALPAAAEDDGPELASARAAIEQGQSRQAMIVLKSRLQQAPDDSAARRLLVRLYLDLGQGAAAQQEIERLRAAGQPAASAAETEDLMVQSGAAWLLQGKYAEVLKDIDPATVQTPMAKAELTAQRGEAELGRGDQAAAEPLLRATLALDPANRRALIGQTRLAVARGDPKAARDLLDQLRAADPGSHDAWELLGELNYLVGDLGAAERALTIDLAHTPRPWVALFKRAMVRIDRGALDDAATDIAAARAAAGSFPGLDLAQGSLALRRGDPAAAAASLERYLQAVPGDRQGLLLLSRALARQARFAQALEHLQQLRELSPQDQDGAALEARIRLAQGQAADAERIIRPFSGADGTAGTAQIAEVFYQALMAQGRTSEALAVAGALTKRFPRQPRFGLALAAGLTAAEDLAAARAQLERLRTQFPDSVEVSLALGRLELTQGHPDAALAQARALVAGSGQDPRVQFLLGQALAGTGNAAGARAAFGRALEISPGFKPAAAALDQLDGRGQAREAADASASPAVGARPDADNTATLLESAIADERAGKPFAAIDRLRQGLEKDPENLKLRLALARRLRRAEDPQRALEVVAATPAAQAQQSAVLRLRGELELTTGRPAQAVQSFEQLAAANPERAAALYLLATARAASGDRAGMQEALVRALRLAPDDPLAGPALDAAFGAAADDGARAELAGQLSAIAPDQPRLAFQQGRLALRKGDAAAAVGYLRAARQRVPEDARYQRALVKALVAANQAEEAVADTQAWLSAHPDDLAARAGIADLLIQQGRDADAAVQLRMILQQRPDDPAAHNNLAMVLLKSDPKAALAEAEQAYAAAPERAEIADTLGAALLANAQAARAVEVLEKAQGAALTNPGLVYRYALALAAVGNTEQARQLLLTITGRDFPEVDAARALLARLQAGSS